MQVILRLSLLALTITALIACSGWRLRGSESHTQLAKESVQLSGQPSETYALIERQLQQKDSLSQAATAQYHLILDQEHWKRRSASVTTQAITAEYELTLTLSYRIVDATEQALKPASQASLTRSYTFDPSDIAGKNKEEALIRSDIRRGIARQILQQLQLLQRRTL